MSVMMVLPESGDNSLPHVYCGRKGNSTMSFQFNFLSFSRANRALTVKQAVWLNTTNVIV